MAWSRWITRANLLSLARPLSAPFLAHAILSGSNGVASLLFAAAILTDLVDGRVARHYGEASPLGGLIDHASDALFVSVGLAALAQAGLIPWLLPICVATAFTQYTLDSRALAGRPLRASALGRWNGIAYFAALGTPIVRDALGLGWPSHDLVRVLAWLLVASTLASMLDRVLALRRP
jgi:phosphatidylglycerophosphate synthase